MQAGRAQILDRMAFTSGRPKSARNNVRRASTTKQRLQSAPNVHGLSLLASKIEAQSKSMEADLSKIGRRRSSVKQAWSPSPKHNLASRSMVTSGHAEPSLPPLRESSRPTSTATNSRPATSSRPVSRIFKAKDGSSYLMIDNELKPELSRVSSCSWPGAPPLFTWQCVFGLFGFCRPRIEFIFRT